MKNQEAIKSEVSTRISVAISLGRFETKAQIASRLIHGLMKQWIGHDGTVWTLRAYLLKHDRKEYRNILASIKSHYSGCNFSQLTGENLDMFNFFHNRANGYQKNYTRYDGRLPVSAY